MANLKPDDSGKDLLPDAVFNQVLEMIAQQIAEKVKGKFERDILDEVLVGVQVGDDLNILGRYLPPGFMGLEPNAEEFFLALGATFAPAAEGVPLCGFMVTKAIGREMKTETVDMEQHEFMGDEEAVMVITGVTIDKRSASALVRLKLEEGTGLVSIDQIHYRPYDPDKPPDLQFWSYFAQFMTGFHNQIIMRVLDNPTEEFAKEFVISLVEPIQTQLREDQADQLARDGMVGIMTSRLN